MRKLLEALLVGGELFEVARKRCELPPHAGELGGDVDLHLNNIVHLKGMDGAGMGEWWAYGCAGGCMGAGGLQGCCVAGVCVWVGVGMYGCVGGWVGE